jgi:hypothetical protein
MQKSLRRILVVGAVAIAAAMTSACSTNLFNTGTAQAQASGAAPASAPAAVSAADKVKAVAVTVDKNCQVGVPFLQSLLIMQTEQQAIDVVKKAQDTAGKVCGVAAIIAHPVAGVPLPTLDLVTVKAFADAELPKLLTLVKGTDKLTKDQKTAAELVITGAQAALLVAVVNAQ